MVDDNDSSVSSGEIVSGGASVSLPGGSIPEGSLSSEADNLPEGAKVEHYGEVKIVRAANGKFLPGTKGVNITRDNAREYKEMAQRATARKIAAEIGKRAGLLPSSAVAVAAGDLWEQIVLNDKSNPKYRFDTWRGLSAAAELLADRRESPQSDGITLNISSDLARVLAERLAEMVKSRSNE